MVSGNALVDNIAGAIAGLFGTNRRSGGGKGRTSEEDGREDGREDAKGHHRLEDKEVDSAEDTAAGRVPKHLRKEDIKSRGR
jgi:hypothetical protein